MKKSLVALAALAATGAFAQVTVTGVVAMGYLQTTHNDIAYAPGMTSQQLFAKGLAVGYNGNPAGDSGGLGVDTAELDFAAVEDLGGGYKAIAKMQFDTVSRKTVIGGDTSLTLITPGGAIAMQSVRVPEYLTVGPASVGAPGWDGRVNNSRGYQDIIAYVLPVGALTFSVARGDNAQFGATTAGLGLGTGDAGTSNQHNTVLGVNYQSGPVIANGQYLSYDNRNTASDLSINYVTRGQASYDFGAVKVMAGAQQTNFATGMTQLVATAGASTSVGAWTFAGNFIQSTLSNSTGSIGSAGATLYATGAALGIAGCSAVAGTCGAGALDGTNNGYGLRGVYNFSKTTNLTLDYRNWSWVSGPARDSEIELYLIKNF